MQDSTAHLSLPIETKHIWSDSLLSAGSFAQYSPHFSFLKISCYWKNMYSTIVTVSGR